MGKGTMRAQQNFGRHSYVDNLQGHHCYIKKNLTVNRPN